MTDCAPQARTSGSSSLNDRLCSAGSDDEAARAAVDGSHAHAHLAAPGDFGGEDTVEECPLLVTANPARQARVQKTRHILPDSRNLYACRELSLYLILMNLAVPHHNSPRTVRNRHVDK